MLYAGILVALGWFLGANYSQGLKYFGAFSWLMFVVVVVAIIVIWQGKRRRDKRVVKREAARFEADHGRTRTRSRRISTQTTADYSASRVTRIPTRPAARDCRCRRVMRCSQRFARRAPTA